jgi:hypothetical protein
MDTLDYLVKSHLAMELQLTAEKCAAVMAFAHLSTIAVVMEDTLEFNVKVQFVSLKLILQLVIFQMEHVWHLIYVIALLDSLVPGVKFRHVSLSQLLIHQFVIHVEHVWNWINACATLVIQVYPVKLKLLTFLLLLD